MITFVANYTWTSFYKLQEPFTSKSWEFVPSTHYAVPEHSSGDLSLQIIAIIYTRRVGKRAAKSFKIAVVDIMECTW